MIPPTSPSERLKHAAIVYNPVALPLERAHRAVSAQEGQHGWGEARWYKTSRNDSGRGAAEAALAAGPAVVIVGGGDGTVRAVAEVVHGASAGTQTGTGTPIALLPTGTGNLLARNVGTPLNDVEACISAAFSERSRAIDVGVAELEDEAGLRHTHVFLVMAGIGLDAEMATSTNALAKKHLGWLAYVPPIARSVVANRLFRLDYRIDGGRARTTRAHTIIVGNCGALTGNMLLIPSAVVDDGLLDVVMMRPGGRFGWAHIGTRLTLQGIAHRSRVGREMFRQAPDLRALVYAQGQRFEARFEFPHTIELDGDSFGQVAAVRISVRPAALRLCLRGTPPPGTG